MGKTHELAVTLRRGSPAQPWGFSLVGGADASAPLIVTRVGFDSPANGALQRGDVITKVGSYDARDIRHQDAQTLFKNSGSSIHVVVQREAQPRHNTSTGSSRTSSHNYSPLSVSPHLSPRAGPYAAPYSPAGSALTPYYTSPLTPIDDNYFEARYLVPGGARSIDDPQDVHVSKQPYRTTPLVLPGAKVKRESGPMECYLRHHPNPAVRAPPHHLDNDYLLRQKVANSVLERLPTGDPNKQYVHKQFNSPINLYSESNVADTMYKQTGVSPGAKKHVKFNPAESETYKAIQEEQLGETVHEITVPPQSRVYAPSRTPAHSRKPAYVVNPSPAYANSVGEQDEPRQSGSFRRLMWSVMPETTY